MIAEYTMKRNGKWYKAGEEVPENPKPASRIPSYSKTDINRMNVSDLKQIAKNTGVDGYENMTGAELKECLISTFGL